MCAASQLSTALIGCVSSIVMPASAASSAIRDGGSFLTVTPGLVSHTRTLPPAAPATTARRAASGVLTLKISAGRTRGGAGASSPSSLRARKRLAAPSFLTPGADAAHSGPLMSVGTMNTRAPTASSRLETE